MTGTAPVATPIQTGAQAVTTTAAAGLGVAGAGSVLIYIIRCIVAGELQEPSAEVSMTVCALLAPIFHAMMRSILKLLGAGDVPQPPPGYMMVPIDPTKQGAP